MVASVVFEFYAQEPATRTAADTARWCLERLGGLGCSVAGAVRVVYDEEGEMEERGGFCFCSVVGGQLARARPVDRAAAAWDQALTLRGKAVGHRSQLSRHGYQTARA